MLVMYILNYLDRNNITAAKLAGLQDDLNLKGEEYQIFVALLACFIVPDLPRTTSWLSNDEKVLAAWRLEEDIGKDDWVDSEHQSMFHGAKLAILDPKAWLLLGVIYGCTSSGAVTTFFPRPDLPPTYDRKPNPALRGVILSVGAWLLDWLWFLPQIIWSNAGFGSLRTIRSHLDYIEPRYDPTVVPLKGNSDENPDGSVADTVSAPPVKYSTKYYSVADYHELYKSGELTPIAVVKGLLPLIRRDLSTPGKHSIAFVDSRVDLVLTAAEESTRRYKEGRPLGLFDGVPAAVKDEFDLDGYRTNMGSLNDYTLEPKSDDPSITNWCIRQLEKAGAIVVGKVSMHEFGLDTTGNNIHYGTPPNPYHPDYYTGGSSSGCAYAVSTGLVPIALGTDGGGSVRIPSSFCSVVGLKPTHNRLSHYPSVNYASTTSVIGPLAADIRSLAEAYRVFATPGPDTPFPAPGPLSLTPSTRGKKILGIPEVWFSRSTPDVQRLCRSLLDKLVTEKDYTIVPIDIPFLVEGQTAHAMTILADGAALLPDTTNITAPNRILLTLGRTTPATDYLLAQKLRRLLMQHLAALWQEFPGMIIVTPTTACAGWPVVSKSELKWGLSDGDRTLKAMEYVWLANFTGIPAISVPAGYADPEGKHSTEGTVPVGLMGNGEWGSEEQLLQWGLEAEELGADLRERPPIWEDVIQRAKWVGSSSGSQETA
ncbi:amidase signature domain-containing protein [Aspergillus flavus]|uniref:Amidase signature domain-containing protein n=1 Tax=Aspergillus flavus TaxID=5059 RepID=A0A5N6GVG8_ASPFL|nr:amidase signature domain-containing protein [Aspergillus flavus]